MYESLLDLSFFFQAEDGIRDVPHLQRLARRLLPPLSRPPDRPRLPAVRRHRRRRARDPSRGHARLARRRDALLMGHGADVPPDVEAVLAGRERAAAAAALPPVPTGPPPCA